MHQTFAENKQFLCLIKKICPFSDYVSPICLPSQSEVGEAFVGETMTVSGWGRESDSSSSIARVSDYMLHNGCLSALLYHLDSFLYSLWALQKLMGENLKVVWAKFSTLS